MSGYGQYSYGRGLVEKPDIPKRTGKRLPHIFDNPAHVAFHPREKDGSGFEQTEAWNKQKNFYFRTSSDGTRVVYSYRDNYIVGSRFKLGHKVVILLRAGKPYSVTTSCHMSATRSAAPKDTKGVEVFTVPAMIHGYDYAQPTKTEHDYNLSYYISEIKSSVEAYQSARCSWKMRTNLSHARELVREVKRYAQMFKVKCPKLPAVPKMDDKKFEAILTRERERDARREQKRAAERAACEAQHAAEVKAWEEGPDACKHVDADGKRLHGFNERYDCNHQREEEEWQAHREELILRWKAGEDVTLRGSYSEPAYLRVKDGNVETSHYAEVPISGAAGAARLWQFLKALKDAGRTYTRNGHSEHIGHFVVESFDGEILHVGCHKISWSECERIAPDVLVVEQAVGA